MAIQQAARRQSPSQLRSIGRLGSDERAEDQLTPLLPARATSDGTLRRLEESALKLFADRGYYGVSIRELAEATGITTSSMYAHVKSKEDLLVSIALIGHAEHHDRLRDALLASPPDPRLQLTALVRAHVRLHCAFPLLAQVANKELHALSPEARGRVVAVREQSERFFLDVISRGIAEGIFEVRKPWLAVAAIGGMGIRVSEWYRPEIGFTIDEVADTYADFALRVVHAKPGGPPAK